MGTCPGELAGADSVWRARFRREKLLEKARLFEVALPPVPGGQGGAAAAAAAAAVVQLEGRVRQLITARRVKVRLELLELEGISPLQLHPAAVARVQPIVRAAVRPRGARVRTSGRGGRRGGGGRGGGQRCDGGHAGVGRGRGEHDAEAAARQWLEELYLETLRWTRPPAAGRGRYGSERHGRRGVGRGNVGRRCGRRRSLAAARPSKARRSWWSCWAGRRGMCK